MARKRPKSGTRKPAENPWPDKLRAIREHYRITQREAAERIGTVLRTWQNWEYGRTQPAAAIAFLINSTFPM